MESREIFWNITQPSWLYVLSLIALLLLFCGLYSHLRIWKKGYRTGGRQPLFRALKSFLVQAFFQRRILRDRYAGLMHLSISWGCFVLLLGTILLAIDYDFLGPFLGLSYMHESFYKIYSFVLDLFGGFALIGTIMAVIRRYLHFIHWLCCGVYADNCDE
jgi:hypothetical protein